MARMNPHIRAICEPRRWRIEPEVSPKVGTLQDSILRPEIGPWLRRCDCPPSWAQVGDFALLDGRAHRITAILPGWRSSRPRYELQDVACPEMPRHRVAWSEIEKLARATDSGELPNLPAKDRGDRPDRPIA